MTHPLEAAWCACPVPTLIPTGAYRTCLFGVVHQRDVCTPTDDLSGFGAPVDMEAS